jgi:hypothetical protein
MHKRQTTLVTEDLNPNKCVNKPYRVGVVQLGKLSGMPELDTAAVDRARATAPDPRLDSRCKIDCCTPSSPMDVSAAFDALVGRISWRRRDVASSTTRNGLPPVAE